MSGRILNFKRELWKETTCCAVLFLPNILTFSGEDFPKISSDFLKTSESSIPVKFTFKKDMYVERKEKLEYAVCLQIPSFPLK